MAFIDYYKIMGIDRNTPQKDIRAAYKKRAKQFHPDLHPNDPKAKAKFQALNEAYDVLNDVEKRKKYDQYGENWKQADAFGQQQQAWGQGGSYGSGFDGFDFSQFSGAGGGFSDFFEQFFGHRAQGSRSRSYGSSSPVDTDVRSTVEIDLYTALLGGEILLQTQTGKLKLKVKPGTQNGTKVRIKGKGRDLGNGTTGDLILTYSVRLPENLNERQKELLRQVRDAG